MVPKIAFTLDGWTSPSQTSFLAVTAHFVDEKWELQDITLGFEYLTGKHTGKTLILAFIRVVERFGLERKVHSITSDNGANVIKLTRDLEEYTHAHPDEW